MTASSLLPLRQEYLTRLANLRELAFPLFRGLHPRSALSGPPTEFEGHRPYLPGDDTRWIDWSLYARLEELYVKVFRVEEEVEILLMVDKSRSMTFPAGRKYEMAAAAAASLAYLALLTSHPVSAVLYSDGPLGSTSPFRHIGALPEIDSLLRSPVQGEGTDLEKSLLPFLLRRRRPVTIIVLSDGFQRVPLEKVIRVVRTVDERRVVFIRMADPDDLRPSLRGNLQVQDIEGQESRFLLTNRALELQIRQRIASSFSELEKTLRRSGTAVLSLPVDGPFEDGFLGMILAAPPEQGKVHGP